MFFYFKFLIFLSFLKKVDPVDLNEEEKENLCKQNDQINFAFKSKLVIII